MSFRSERTETAAMNASFRSAFRIPPGHELRCISWRGNLTGASQEWDHHELDQMGNLLGRYESWLTESSDGVDTGYRHYDPAGVLVSRGWLPPIRGD